MFNPEEFKGGYTKEEKQEALNQANKENIRTREISIDQQMNDFFDRHSKESGGDKENAEYFNVVEEEYQDGHLEIPLAQIQFESSLYRKDAATFLREGNQQKLYDAKQKISELSFLEKGLSDKIGVSKEKFNLNDLKERLRGFQKQYEIDVRKNKEDTLSHSQFVKYNKLVESFDEENFDPEIWKEVLTEVDNQVLEIEGSRDDILQGLANKNLDSDVDMARERLKGIIPQGIEWQRYKDLLEEKLYGPGPKTFEEKQKIDNLRK